MTTPNERLKFAGCDCEGDFCESADQHAGDWRAFWDGLTQGQRDEICQLSRTHQRAISDVAHEIGVAV